MLSIKRANNLAVSENLSFIPFGNMDSGQFVLEPEYLRILRNIIMYPKNKSWWLYYHQLIHKTKWPTKYESKIPILHVLHIIVMLWLIQLELKIENELRIGLNNEHGNWMDWWFMSVGNDMQVNVDWADKNVMWAYGNQRKNNSNERKRQRGKKWNNKKPQRMRIQLQQ